VAGGGWWVVGGGWWVGRIKMCHWICYAFVGLYAIEFATLARKEWDYSPIARGSTTPRIINQCCSSRCLSRLCLREYKIFSRCWLTDTLLPESRKSQWLQRNSSKSIQKLQYFNFRNSFESSTLNKCSQRLA
jgi:hypothetical protein